MIKIEKPSLFIEKGKAIVSCDIYINDVKKTLFYEISDEYKDYLCIERADAFVIAALYYAMKFHHDIYCELPMTSELYHNITKFLIPTLAKHSDRFKVIKLNVPITSEKLDTYNAVGTGLSCGIDSFHVIKNYLNPECNDMKLTCFCLNNVGSFKAYNVSYRGIGVDKARIEITKKSQIVADELGLPLIITNSNLSQVFPEVYYRVHTFANMFSVFLMQKYFSKYYYASSGYDLSHYDVIDSPALDSSEYDILNFYCFQTPTLKIYPEGNEKTRLEKTIDIADYEFAQKHLHVCIKDSNNCGICLKCRRTMLMLDAIGKLEKFNKVFDVNYYKKHKDEYLVWLKKEEEENHEMNVLTALLINQKNIQNEYVNIEKFNEKNIIIPNYDIDCISIREEKSILNKNHKKVYKSNLSLALSICIEIAKLENKKIFIPRYCLDNVFETLKTKPTLRKKLGYIKRLILNKKISINLYDLIYFVLYKPEVVCKIANYLVDKKILQEKIFDYEEKTYSSTLAFKFQNFIKYDLLKSAISIDEVTIKDYVLVNSNNLLKVKDSYYQNLYDYKILWTDKKRYYFVGVKDNYVISIINKYDGEKKQILNEICKIVGLVNKL